MDLAISHEEEQQHYLKLRPLPPQEELERKWRSLEARCNNSFFTSWSWIGCWLDCLPGTMNPVLAEISDHQGVPAGLAILVERRYYRHGILPVSAVYLNSTGDPDLDSIRIEYNDILCESAHADRFRQMLLASLLAEHSGVEELAIDGACDPEGWTHRLPRHLVARENNDIGRSVDLSAVRTSGDSLSLLSANTRSNVRRSQKELARLGPLKLEMVGTLQAARAHYLQLQKLHNSYWLSRGQPGAFSNPFLRNFHHRLIEREWSSGQIQLLSMEVGARVVGVLYNFVYRGHVYSYQSGFDYAFAGKHARPGLVAHSLAIAFNAEQGHRVYDFMAGDSQYKRSLASNATPIHWITLQRNCAKFVVERWVRNKLRAIRRTVSRRDSGQSGTRRSEESS